MDPPVCAGPDGVGAIDRSVAPAIHDEMSLMASSIAASTPALGSKPAAPPRQVNEQQPNRGQRHADVVVRPLLKEIADFVAADGLGMTTGHDPINWPLVVAFWAQAVTVAIPEVPGPMANSISPIAILLDLEHASQVCTSMKPEAENGCYTPAQA